MLARSIFFVLLGLSVALFSCSKDRPTPVAPAGKSLASLAAPAAPTNLRFDAPTDSSCTVRWEAADGATDYDVNYKPAVGGRWTNEPHRGTGLYNTIHDLQPNTEYRWAVRAENSDGTSKWIHGPNFTTLPENQDRRDSGAAVSSPEKPASPTNLRFDAPTDSSCTVRWDASDGATDYDINYKPAVGGRWINEPHTGDGLHNTIHDLQPNTEYRWAVRAENSNGASEWAFGPNFTTLPDDTEGSEFNIELVFMGDFPEEDKLIVREMADHWERVIVGDMPDHPVDEEIIRLCGDHASDIDDIHIHVSTGGGDYYIDDYEILYADINTGLPVISSVALIPIKDRRKPKDKQHRKIPELMIGAAHNIGHALGFSDQSYAYRSRLQESETHEETFFTGPLSVSVFNSLGGYVWEWGKVPLIDYGQDRPRTTNNNCCGADPQSHWLTPLLVEALMVSPSESIGAHEILEMHLDPISVIDAAAMADIGYTVSLSQARPIKLHALSCSWYSRPRNCFYLPQWTPQYQRAPAERWF